MSNQELLNKSIAEDYIRQECKIIDLELQLKAEQTRLKDLKARKDCKHENIVVGSYCYTTLTCTDCGAHWIGE